MAHGMGAHSSCTNQQHGASLGQQPPRCNGQPQDWQLRVLHAVLVLHAGVPHPNDYGIELSVSCHAETSQGKQLNLERTARVRNKQTLPDVLDAL